MTKVTIDRALLEQAISEIELAQENLRPHGDNCFLHDDGEYNSCFCGLDSLTAHMSTVAESIESALAEPAVEPAKKGLFVDLIAQHPGLAEELAAIVIDAPPAEPAVEPVKVIPLKDGKHLKLEPFYFLGPVCWVLYTEDGKQIRALDEFESGFVNAALKASPPPPAEPARTSQDVCTVPLLSDEEIHGIYDEVARSEPYSGAVTRRNVARAIEHLVRRKAGL